MVEWEVPPTRRIAFTLVLVLLGASVLVTWLVDFRLGGYLLAASAGLAAALRATLPDRYCLGLLVRSRRFDVVVAALFAMAVGVLAAIVPPR
jgi:hypothetical protein